MANILNDASIALSNATLYNSMSSLNMSWVMDPEPASDIFATCNPGLTQKQSLSLMDWNTLVTAVVNYEVPNVANNTRTLLNPLNVRDFFSMIDNQEYM